MHSLIHQIRLKRAHLLWVKLRAFHCCRSGQVTEQMLQTTDNKKFALIGFLEATAQVVSMICVSKLPGAAPEF